MLASPAISGDTAAVGVAMLVVSAVGWAFGNVYMKWRDFSRVSPVMLVGVQLMMSASILIPVALVFEGTAETRLVPRTSRSASLRGDPRQCPYLRPPGDRRHRATPTQASASAYLIPVFGVTFGWLIRDERLGLTEALGGALVVAGVYLVVTSAARQSMAEAA